MSNRRVRPPRSALKTGRVVLHRRVGRLVGDERLSAVSALLVGAGFEQRHQRREQLPSTDLVWLARRSSTDSKHCRASLLGERGPSDARGYMNERPHRSIVNLSVQLEPGMARDNDIKLLAGLRLRFLMLIDEPVAACARSSR